MSGFKFDGRAFHRAVEKEMSVGIKVEGRKVVLAPAAEANRLAKGKTLAEARAVLDRVLAKYAMSVDNRTRDYLARTLAAGDTISFAVQ